VADPIIARFRLTRRWRPGHEKHLPGLRAWAIGRFAEPSAPLPANRVALEPAARAARAALGCGDLSELLAAIEQPLGARRFLRNLALAPRLTRLRFSSEPDQARDELCGGRR